MNHRQSSADPRRVWQTGLTWACIRWGSVLVILNTASGPSDHLGAQTFATLHSFSALQNGTNIDGAAPVSALTLSSNTLYGTASYGGPWSNGIVFGVKTDGSGFSRLHAFTGGDGADPGAELVISGGILYGTTYAGGTVNAGTVFALKVDGSGFQTLYNFFGDTFMIDGSAPGDLVLSERTLYGVTTSGGAANEGTVYSISIDGTRYAIVYNFNLTGDGGHPNGLILLSNRLYGTAIGGGNLQSGTVFVMETNGDNFMPLYNFTNSTGSQPHAGLVLSGDIVYGTTFDGGDVGINDSGVGIVFALKTDGTWFSVLHTFRHDSGLFVDQNMTLHYTNSDGAFPASSMILFGNMLYGTTLTGGSSGNGTVFEVKTDGSGFTNLHAFSALSNNTNSDGANPRAHLILSENTLYGTTEQGGSSGNGTIFSISLTGQAPQLKIARWQDNVVLTWPAGGSSVLQSTTDPASSWTTITFSPVVVNGQNTVTNPLLARPQFFRLKQ